MRMSEIETYANVVEVRAPDHLDQPVRRRKFVRNILQEDAYAQRLGKGPQVLDGGHRRLELLFAETLVRRSEMLHQETERNLLGNFKGALDLVHGVDARCAVGGGNVDRRRPCPSPLVVRVQRRMHRIERYPAAAEPVSNFFHVRFAIGVVKVLPRRENLDRLHSAASQPIQNPRMQPLFREQICGNRFQHARPL